MVRGNLAESLLAVGQRDAAIDQLSHVWHLTETADCLNGPAMWRGVTHGVLAEINFWRGWMDEANRQADLCLEAFPPEQRATPTAQNLVGVSRAIKGAAALAAGDLDSAQKYMEIAPKTGPKRSALAFVLFVSSTVRAAAGDGAGAFAQASAALEASPGYFPGASATGARVGCERAPRRRAPSARRSFAAPSLQPPRAPRRALLRELGGTIEEPAPQPQTPPDPMTSAPMLLSPANTASPTPVTL